MRKTRVLIIEDSDVVLLLLKAIIASDPRLEVVGMARSAEEGLRLLDKLLPDVVSLDIRLPGMNGFEATRRIMADKPTPIVVVSASVESEDLRITMNALQAGALAVVEKPVGVTHAAYKSLAEHLCTQLAIMSQVKVVRQRRSIQLTGPECPPAKKNPGPPQTRAQPSQFPLMLGIVSSTGGPNALAHLLGALSRDFPLPIVLVQHIAAQFIPGFAAWLESVCPFQVVMVSAHESPKPGRVYIAAGDRHLHASATSVWVEQGDPVCSQRPSGSVLFQSMASSLGRQAIGVILTGMGEDGAEGLLALRRAGGHTIAEDQTTAVVYGMPAAAVGLNAICELLPLTHIAARLETLVSNMEVMSHG